jgi:glycosyltransferase involved in cell wall biosynthesis
MIAAETPEAGRAAVQTGAGERPLVVAYVMNQKLYRVESRYFIPMPNIVDLAQAWRRYADRIIICLPTIESTPPPDAEPIPPDVEVFELPYYSSNLDLILRSPVLGFRFVRRFLPALRGWDAAGGDAPSGFGVAAALLATLAGKTGFFYVRGDLPTTLAHEYRDHRLRGALVRGVFWPIDVLSRLLSAAGMLTLALGPELASRYRGPRLHLLRGYVRPAVAGALPPEPVSEAGILQHIGYVGRLSAEKGPDILLRAFAQVAASRPLLRLSITGDGQERDNLAALAQELAISDRVVFTAAIGDPDRLRDIYRSSGIIVVPSWADGIPMVMMEAMSLGRAVVATRVGGTPSVLLDGVNGLLVEPGDVTGMARGIARLLDDPELAFRLAGEAVTSSRSLTIDDQAGEMMGAVRHAVERKR